MSLVDLPKKTPDTPAGGYLAPAHVYVDAAGKICEADDPAVAELRYPKGSPVPADVAAQLGLVEAKPAKPPEKPSNKPAPHRKKKESG